jgi:sucrose-6-phosphate hydrolase SacC (GH32 family)
MSNWEYANDVSTSPWRGAMSLPRALSLRKAGDHWFLLQRPVRELEKLRGERRHVALNDVNGPADLSSLNKGLADEYEIEADLEPSPEAVFDLHLKTGAAEVTVLRCDVPERKLTLDRTRSGKVDFHKQFPGRYIAPVRLMDGRLKLRIFVDASSVEVFVNEGETVLTSLIMPSAGGRRVELRVDRGGLRRADLRVWNLAPAGIAKP